VFQLACSGFVVSTVPSGSRRRRLSLLPIGVDRFRISPEPPLFNRRLEVGLACCRSRSPPCALLPSFLLISFAFFPINDARGNLERSRGLGSLPSSCPLRLMAAIGFPSRVRDTRTTPFVGTLPFRAICEQSDVLRPPHKGY